MIIQGFRSYRDQTIVEPFSPRHNVIGMRSSDNNVMKCSVIFNEIFAGVAMVEIGKMLPDK